LTSLSNTSILVTRNDTMLHAEWQNSMYNGYEIMDTIIPLNTSFLSHLIGLTVSSFVGPALAYTPLP
jgi:hypothetical protein